MEIVVWVVGGIVVFVVAAVAVGRVSHDLSLDPERSVYDVDQSVEFVAEALPESVTARLSYDDVTMILRLFHDHMHARGVSTTAGEDNRRGGIQVVDPDEGADHVMERMRLAGVHFERADVDAVIAAQLEYFVAIGVVGERVDDPEELDD